MKYGFRASAEKNVLKIYDDIGGWFGVTTDEIEKQLENANNLPLEIRINSYGGEVFEGFAIYNILSRYEGHKTVIVDGICASIASVIAMCGDEIKMHKASMMMIHNASGGCYGTSKEMAELAEALSKINEIIKDIYLKKVNVDRDKLTEMMDAEKFLTAQECIDMNFANEIVDDDVDPETTQEAYNNMQKALTDKIETLHKLQNIRSLNIEKENTKELKPENKTFNLFKKILKEEI